MKADRKDPAERSGYLRYFYRDWHPTRLGKIWSRFYAFVAGLGVLPDFLISLQVKDRISGRLVSTILVKANYEGRQFLVSMLGDRSGWVENLRTSGGNAFIKRERSRPVKLTEIEVKERAPILKQWSRVATSGRNHLPVSPDAPLSEFEAIAADYPVFRIDALPGKPNS